MNEYLTKWDRFRFSIIPKKFYLRLQAKRASRKWETELNFLQHIVPNGSNAIDGGANKGVYSWYLSQICERVYAFEPNPSMFRYLREAVPKNTECYNYALSDSSGESSFHLPTSTGIFHNTRGSLLPVKGNTGCKEFQVETKRVDDFNFKNISFIKLDIEGAELLALKGAKKTIASQRPVILTETMQVGGSSNHELSLYLIKLNYVPMVYSNGLISCLSDKSLANLPHNCFYVPLQ